MLKAVFLALVAISTIEAIPVHVGDWNNLLRAEGIFHDEINLIQSKSSNAETILSELKELLGQDNVLDTLYSKYLSTHNKIVADPEPSKKIFYDSLIEVAVHNLEAKNGEHSWLKGVNKFADMSPEDFLAKYTTKFDDLSFGINPTFADLPPVPTQSDTKDWVKEGKATEVKDQEQCGSCTTFAASATMETAAAIKNNADPVSLSAQELLDCMSPGSDICNQGSDPRDAFKYMNSTGLSTWEEYGYTGSQGDCNAPQGGNKVQSTNFAFVRQKSESDLKKAAARGPVAVVVGVNQDFQKYSKGVFTKKCANELNHAVSLMGYDVVGGRKTWIIKNSWGNWGDKGYIRIQRDAGNHCGVASYAITPTM